MTQSSKCVKWTEWGTVHSAGGVTDGELSTTYCIPIPIRLLLKQLKQFPMTKAVKLQAINTFKPYAVFYRTGGQIEKFHFINGWGASVANHDGSYGGDEGLYELAEINPNGHIVDDSIKGFLTFAEVDCYLREISEY